MSVSDWERKRTLDAMFAHSSPQQRIDFLERVKKEQDKMGKEQGDKNGKKTVSVKAPPFKKKDKKATEPAKKAGEPGKGGKKKSAKPDVDESVVTGQLGMITPRPMYVNSLPGNEIRNNLGFSSKTSAGSDDGHTHEAYYDEAGNGYTSDDDGHAHDVRSFVVANYQTPHGQQSHGHTDVLPRQDRTPGAEQRPYYGIL